MPYMVEQIDSALNIIDDYDDKMSAKDRNGIFEKLFAESAYDIKFEKLNNTKYPIITVGEQKILILSKQITYLGKPHALYKKRIQIPNNWINIYNNLSCAYTILMVGVYRYKDNVIFVNFDPTNYIERNLNNSSAHVYTNDLYQAMLRPYFMKQDKNGNMITCIRYRYFIEYLKGNITYEDEIITIIKHFNQKFPFGKEIFGIKTYKTMLEENYNNALKSEWPGYYLEFLFSKFLKNSVETHVLIYQQNKSKDDKLDFDLWSEKYQYYADLKSSSIECRDIPLNDQESIIRAIEQFGKLWYIVYEHETKKDSLLNYVTTKYWNHQLAKDNSMSYAGKMKGSVLYKSMVVMELNRVNYREGLKQFNQGINSNGKPRNPKYKFSKGKFNDDNYIIYRERGVEY